MGLGKITEKRGIATRDFVIASLVFSGIIALGVIYIAGVSDQYDSILLTNENFAQNYDRLTNMTERVNTARKSAGDPGGLSFKGTFDVAYQSTFTVIQVVYSSLDLFGNMTGSFAEDFGLDPTVTNIVIIVGLAALTVILVWNVISSISRGKL